MTGLNLLEIDISVEDIAQSRGRILSTRRVRLAEILCRERVTA